MATGAKGLKPVPEKEKKPPEDSFQDQLRAKLKKRADSANEIPLKVDKKAEPVEVNFQDQLKNKLTKRGDGGSVIEPTSSWKKKVDEGPNFQDQLKGRLTKREVDVTSSWKKKEEEKMMEQQRKESIRNPIINLDDTPIYIEKVVQLKPSVILPPGYQKKALPPEAREESRQSIPNKRASYQNPNRDTKMDNLVGN